MAWPKGRKRKPVSVASNEPVSVETVVSPTMIAVDLDPPLHPVLAIRREIAALRVRDQWIPRELRIHDHSSTTDVARIVRREMRMENAPDHEVEQRVAQHLKTLPS